MKVYFGGLTKALNSPVPPCQVPCAAPELSSGCEDEARTAFTFPMWPWDHQGAFPHLWAAGKLLHGRELRVLQDKWAWEGRCCYVGPVTPMVPQGFALVCRGSWLAGTGKAACTGRRILSSSSGVMLVCF